MKVSIKFGFYIIFLLCSNELFSAEIVNFRFGSNSDLKRIVLDLSEDVTFSNKVLKKKIEINFDTKIFLKNRPRKNNSLENIVLKKYQVLTKIKSYLRNLGKPIFVRMSGSGSAFIAYYASKRQCDMAQKQFNKQYKKYWCISSKTI